MNALKAAFRRQGAEVGHLKMLLSVDGRLWAANLTHTEGDIVLRGQTACSAENANLTINARIEMSPEDLERLVKDQVRSSCAKFGVREEVIRLQCLSPGRPNPTYRYDGVINE